MDPGVENAQGGALGCSDPHTTDSGVPNTDFTDGTTDSPGGSFGLRNRHGHSLNGVDSGPEDGGAGGSLEETDQNADLKPLDFDDVDDPDPQPDTKSEGPELMCRICHDGASAGKLISPCKCKVR